MQEILKVSPAFFLFKFMIYSFFCLSSIFIKSFVILNNINVFILFKNNSFCYKKSDFWEVENGKYPCC